MLIFGGNGNRDDLVFELDLNEMKWSSLNNVSYKREGHSANLIVDSIYLFGGYTGSHKNDIHKYDIKN